MVKSNIIHSWQRDDKINSSKHERSLMVKHLKKQDYVIEQLDGKVIKEEWVGFSESIIEIFLDEKLKDNWVYVGSNDSAFLEFLSFDIPISMALTDKVLVANTNQHELIKFFLSNKPVSAISEDILGDIFEFKKTSGVLVYEDFLAPNTAIPKFMGNFNELFSKRAALDRPTLFLDLRTSSPPIEDVFGYVEQMYGKRVECFFRNKGVFKFYSFKCKTKKVETEKIA